MYEQNYRVGGDMYRLRQEALRREKGAFPGVAYATEKEAVRREADEVFRVRPDELRVCWDGSSYSSAYETAPRPVETIHAPVGVPEHEKEPEHKQGLLEKLNLKTDDIILIGLLIFLIYCKADWDIIVIIGALIFVGWFPEGLHLPDALHIL